MITQAIYWIPEGWKVGEAGLEKALGHRTAIIADEDDDAPRSQSQDCILRVYESAECVEIYFGTATQCRVRAEGV